MYSLFLSHPSLDMPRYLFSYLPLSLPAYRLFLIDSHFVLSHPIQSILEFPSLHFPDAIP
jgi:hypothetical protein